MDYSRVNLLSSYAPPVVVGAGTLVTNYSYDLDHMLTQVDRPDGLSVVATPDFAGRLQTLTLPTGTITYNYNSTTGNVDSQLGPAGEDLSFGYDGRLPKDITFSGTVAGTVHHDFDDHFRVKTEAINGGSSVTTDYYGDGAPFHVGALTLVRSAQTGLLSSTTLGGTSETYTPNSFGELQDYAAKFGTTTLLSESYGRDLLGRVHTKTETIDGATHTTRYEYDLQGRLKDVFLDGTLTAHYEYDPNGNRTLGPAGEVGIADAQDRLTSYGSATYTYGANGELQTKSDGGQTTSYTYNVLGNLMHVGLPDATAIDYVVDAMGRRVAKKVNGVLVKGFLYRDQLRIAAELDGSNNVVATFVHGSKANVPDYMMKGGATYRIISDYLGSVRLVVNANDGTVAQRMDYDAWGNVLASSSGIGFQPFGFAGGLYDADTGLVHFGARDYDPSVGRWTAKDPILFGGMQANLYVYVGDDPVSLFDPTGLCPTGFLASLLPDYVALPVSIGGIISVALEVTIDRHGHVYFGAGGSVGPSLWPVAPGLLGGYLNTGHGPALEPELNKFLEGDAVNFTITPNPVMPFAGGGITNSSGGTSIEVGLYTPQISGTFTHNWDLGKFPISW
jgi:RHS repeat-associated protein